MLLPGLLDGLTWRSRLSDGGMRCVNNVIQHLLVAADGTKIVCHSVLVQLADVVWAGFASRSFLWRKAWFL